MDLTGLVDFEDTEFWCVTLNEHKFCLQEDPYDTFNLAITPS